MKKNKKKLPRYWIGTRMPTGIGYLKAKKGANKFSITPGEDLSGTATAKEKNIGLEGILKFGETIQTPLLMLQNTTRTIIPTATTNAISNAAVSGSMVGASSKAAADAALNTMASSGVLQALSTYNPVTAGTDFLNTITTVPTDSIMSNATTNTLGNVSTNTSQLASNAVDTAITDVGTNTAGTGVARTALTGLGRAIGMAGTLYGGIKTIGDFANSGPDLSLSLIAKTSPVTTVTTDYGNTYTQHGGIDRNSILKYADAEKKTKQIGATMDMAGTLMSAGGVLGSIVPGLGTFAGTVAGGLLGVAAGGIASLLGYGDNKEEYEQMMRNQQDVFAMQDMLSESLAKDKDTKAAFYERAANGKLPGFSSGTPNARVSNGEGIAKYANGLIYDLKRVPGAKNNDDTVKTHLGKNDIVFSNKFGISDEAMVDPYSALARQTMLLNMGILGKNRNKNAKNGRLPHFWGGTPILYINAFVPHLYGLLEQNKMLNEIKNSDRTVPKATINDFGANDVVNDMYSDLISPREYIKQAYDLYKPQLWEGRRNVILGPGGKAVYNANLYNLMQRQLADTRLKIDEANRTQRNSARQLKFLDALNKRGYELDNFWKSDNRGAQINAAYINSLWKNSENKYNILSSLARNVGQIYNVNDSINMQNKMLGLYQQQVNLDKLKYLNSLKS